MGLVKDLGDKGVCTGVERLAFAGLGSLNDELIASSCTQVLQYSHLPFL